MNDQIDRDILKALENISPVDRAELLAQAKASGVPAHQFIISVVLGWKKRKLAELRPRANGSS